MSNVVRSFVDALALALPTAPTPTNAPRDDTSRGLEEFRVALSAVNCAESSGDHAKGVPVAVSYTHLTLPTILLV